MKGERCRHFVPDVSEVFRLEEVLGTIENSGVDLVGQVVCVKK